MFLVGSWNIWGLNTPKKQKTVHSWTQTHNLDIIGLLETKIAAANLDSITPKIAPSHWQYFSNTSSSPTCRILVGWNPHKLHLIPLHFSSQWLTCEVNQPNQSIPTRITFVYGQNTPTERQALWEYIAQESGTNGCTPWLVMGDFNAIMQASDRYGGDTQWPCYQDDFSTCINHSELIQVPYTGIKYSWNNGQHGANLI